MKKWDIHEFLNNSVQGTQRGRTTALEAAEGRRIVALKDRSEFILSNEGLEVKGEREKGKRFKAQG